MLTGTSVFLPSDWKTASEFFSDTTYICLNQPMLRVSLLSGNLKHNVFYGKFQFTDLGISSSWSTAIIVPCKQYGVTYLVEWRPLVSPTHNYPARLCQWRRQVNRPTTPDWLAAAGQVGLCCWATVMSCVWAACDCPSQWTTGRWTATARHWTRRQVTSHQWSEVHLSHLAWWPHTHTHTHTHINISPSHPGPLSLLPSVGLETGTDQSVVMLCGWEVKTGMVHSTCG